MVSPAETPDTPPAPEGVIVTMISERHQESLDRTQRLAAAVGTELKVNTIEPEESVPPEPGVYLYSDQIDLTRNSTIIGAKFDIEPKILSGKIDSAHAVLPGLLAFLYRKPKGQIAEGYMNVAAKGYY